MADQLVQPVASGAASRSFDDLIRSDLATHSWAMQETDGTTAEDQIGSSDGTYISGPDLDGDGQVSRVQDGNSVDFTSGSTQYVEITGVDDIKSNTVGMIEAIITPETLHDGIVMSGAATGSANVAVAFWVLSNGKIRMLHRRNTGANDWLKDSTSVVYAAGDRLHVALVQDGVSPELWVNGVNQALTDVGGQNDNTSWFSNTGVPIDRLRIGWYNTSINIPFNGLISRASIYDFTPSDEQIKSHHLAALNGQ